MGSRAIFSNKQVIFYFLFFTFFSLSLAVCRENSPTRRAAGNSMPPKTSKNVAKKPIVPVKTKGKNSTTHDSPSGKNLTGKHRQEDLLFGNDVIIGDDIIGMNFNESLIKDQDKNDIQTDPTRYVASVRIFPSELHCCSASFISKSVLITSAKCIYGRNPAKAFVHALSHLLEMNGISVPVKTFHTHPEFESLPPLNDIGIITLWEPVNGVSPLLLPPPMPLDYRLDDVIVYGWQFSHHRRYFYLRGTVGDHISNAKCTIILREKLDCSTTICAANSHIIHGSYDDGLPLIHTEDESQYIVGIYNRQGIVPRVKIDKYEKVVPHLEWIKAFLKHKD